MKRCVGLGKNQDLSFQDLALSSQFSGMFCPHCLFPSTSPEVRLPDKPSVHYSASETSGGWERQEQLPAYDTGRTGAGDIPGLEKLPCGLGIKGKPHRKRKADKADSVVSQNTRAGI